MVPMIQLNINKYNSDIGIDRLWLLMIDVNYHLLSFVCYWTSNVNKGFLFIESSLDVSISVPKVFKYTSHISKASSALFGY